MSDLWRNLPLSSRPAEDESTVSSDWRPRTAAALRALADSLTPLPEARWSEPSLRPGRGGVPATVRETIDDLVWRLGASAFERIFPPDRTARSRDDLLADLHHWAHRVERGRRGIGDLTAVAEHAYDVTLPLGLPDPVDSRGSGAVALARAAAAPTPLRGLLRGRTLAASDAGWRIGTGPEIRGTAAELVAWLSGRAVRPVFAPADAGPAGRTTATETATDTDDESGGPPPPADPRRG
ncbi:MAG TPA: hypothetical protein VIL55_03175 [Naasia sp.]|jgi:hypothetical protein